jgi:hypothetical protein
MLRVLLLIAICAPLAAQTSYSSAPNASLTTPFPAFAGDTINVTGVGGVVSSIRVGLRIDDPYEQDSDAWLVPPGVTWNSPYSFPPPAGVIELSTDNGGPNANYGTGSGASTVYTYFSTADDRDYAATAGRIDDAVPPFTLGVYLPEGLPDFVKLYGASPNGAWKMVVSDDHGYTGNTFVGWSIDFHTSFDIATRAALPVAPVGAPYSTLIKAANGTPGFNWSFTGTLPTGLTLQQQGDDYLLSGTPQSGAVGTHSVTITCVDQSAAPVNKTFTVRVTDPSHAAPFLDTFSTDTGWTLDQTWARGAATAYTGGSSSEPGVDTTPASTDNMILGDNIGAYYGTPIPKTLFATSPVIDCSQLTTVELRYWRCLGVRRRDHNFQAKSSVDISNDGVTWTNIDANNDADIADNGWIFQRFDVTPWAAGHATVQVRFGIGDNNDSLTLHTGWCVDDFELREIPDTATLTISSLEILSPDVSGSAPKCFVGGSYYCRATIDNAGTLDVLVDGFAGYVTTFGAPGTLEAVGRFAIATPFTIPGSAVSHVVYGVFHCDALATTGSGTTLRGELSLSGEQLGTGLRVEATATETFSCNTPPPTNAALLAYEGPAGGNLLFPEAPAAGPFAFTLRDVAAGPSASVTVVIYNQGGTDLTVGLPQLVPASTEFALDTTGMLTVVPPSTFTSFTVSFDPTVPGTHTTGIEIQHGDASIPAPFAIQVSGVGVNNAPIMEVRENGAAGAPIANGAAGARDFGSQDIQGGPGTWMPVHIRNAGTTPLVLGVPLLTGSNSSEFELNLSGVVLTLAGNAETTFSVRFNPIATGLRSALVQFAHNDPSLTSTFEFEVAGTGIELLPVLEVREGGATGTVIAGGASASGGRDFGAQDVDAGATTPVTIHVANTGQADLAVGQALLSGPNMVSFVLSSSTLPAVITPGNSATFTIAFDPAAAGVKHASISFTHTSSTGTNPFTFDVRGTGTDPNGVQITTTAVTDAVEGKNYTFRIKASGGTAPHLWSAAGGSLPNGITLGIDGMLSGIPASQGMSAFTVRVTDDQGGTFERQLTLQVLGPVSSTGKGSNGGSDGGSCSGSTSSLPGLLLALAPFVAGAVLRRRTSGS